MAMFRCHNEECSDHPGGLPQFDFWANEPKCPKCGMTGEKEQVRQIVTIHYDPPHPKLKDHGTNYLACNPKRPVTSLGDKHAATGNVEVVNCPNCKETDAYKANVPDPYGDIPPIRELRLDGRGLDLQAKLEAEMAEKMPPKSELSELSDLMDDGCC